MHAQPLCWTINVSGTERIIASMILSVCSAGSGELRSRRRSSTATPVSKLAPAFLGSPALSTRVRSVTATVIRRLSEVTDTRRLSRCRYPRSSARGRRLSRQMTRKAAAARARNCRTPAVMRACRRRRRLRLDPSSLDHAHGCSHVGFYDWQVMKRRLLVEQIAFCLQSQYMYV